MLRILIFILSIKFLTANEVFCTFDTLTFWGYTCGVVNQTVSDKNEVIFNIDAIDRGKSYGDVNCVEFVDSEVDFVPDEIFTTFPSADRLIFINNGFKKWKKEFLKDGLKLIAFVNVDNLLESLDDDSFAYVPNLLLLTLYNNRISEISGGAFRGLNQLTLLQLSGNKLTSIDENLFRGLDSLGMLDLFDNELSILPLGLFDNNEMLETLRLDGNKFCVIAAGVFDRNSNLESLNLTNNLIFSINAEVLPEKLQVIFVGE